MLALQERAHCALLNTPDIESLYKFENFPVFMGCTTEAASTDICAPMEWGISKQSGLLQLQKLIPIEILYANSHGSGCVGALWQQHHQAFAEFIHRVNPQGVIEIGGGHGLLSKAYLDTCTQTDWTIIEPNPTPAEGVNATYVKGFFDDTFIFQGEYGAIVHSHVLEHIYEPHKFMKHIASFTQPGKWHMFSIPNIQRMIERFYTNGINFEHTLGLTEPYVEYLLASHGFRICEKIYFKEDHSIFYATMRDPQVNSISLSPSLYEQNKQLYLTYVQYHKTLVSGINDKIREAQSPVYLFGAHIFSQSIIAFGLDTSRMNGILDNDSHKQGKRLYGTSLWVSSPHELKKLETPIVILKAGVYNAEIKKDILENFNPRTVFWE